MKNIFFLGLVSFFADISSEMVYPIIPLYLTSVFGATPALVGLIEGFAESLASLLKVYSGYITDRYQHKKPIAFIGYATGLIYKIALIFSTSWTGILIARLIDRLGKGIRTSPRDVMVSESAKKGEMGLAFGIHKALDMAGSALGILLAFLILSSMKNGMNYKKLFLISIIPIVLSLAIFPFIVEKRNARDIKKREPFWKNFKNLNGQLKLYIFVAFLFTLGNSSNAFLLLRAKSLGFTDVSVILLYFIYNLTASLLSIPLGKKSDSVGRKKILSLGYIVFSVVYLGFAFAHNKAFMIFLFVLYGVYTSLTAGVERALIAEISPKSLKGTMLGLHSTVVGIALLPASTIAGILWSYFGVRVPFIFGGVLSLICAIILIVLMKDTENTLN